MPGLWILCFSAPLANTPARQPSLPPGFLSFHFLGQFLLSFCWSYCCLRWLSDALLSHAPTSQQAAFGCLLPDTCTILLQLLISEFPPGKGPSSLWGNGGNWGRILLTMGWESAQKSALKCASPVLSPECQKMPCRTEDETGRAPSTIYWEGESAYSELPGHSPSFGFDGVKSLMPCVFFGEVNLDITLLVASTGLDLWMDIV